MSVPGLSHPRDDDGPDEPLNPAKIDEFAADIRSILTDRAVLQEVFTDLRLDDIDGENVQPRLNNLYDEFEAVTRVSRIADLSQLDAALTQAANADALDETEVQEFTSFFEESLAWAVPGVEAYLREDSEGTTAFTDASVGLARVGDRAVIEHRLSYGVDTIHEIEVSVDKFVADAIHRLRPVIGALPKLIDEDELDPEALANICELTDDLEEVFGALQEISEVVEQRVAADAEGSGEAVPQELAAFVEEGAPAEGTERPEEATDNRMFA
jgi:hypothetical protein